MTTRSRRMNDIMQEKYPGCEPFLYDDSVEFIKTRKLLTKFTARSESLFRDKMHLLYGDGNYFKHTQWRLFSKEVIYSEVARIVPSCLIKHYFHMAIVRFGNVPQHLLNIFPTFGQVCDALSLKVRELVNTAYSDDVILTLKKNETSKKRLKQLEEFYKSVFRYRNIEKGHFFMCLCGVGKRNGITIIQALDHVTVKIAKGKGCFDSGKIRILREERFYCEMRQSAAQVIQKWIVPILKRNRNVTII